MTPDDNSLISLPAAKPITVLKAAQSLCFLPEDDRLIVSKVHGKSNARAVSALTGVDLWAYPDAPANVRVIAVTDDGQTVAFASQRRTLTFCDANTGALRHKLKVGNDGELSGLAFAPGSNTLLHATWDGLTQIDGASGQIIRTLAPEHDPAGSEPMYWSIAFSNSGIQAAVAWGRPDLGINVSLFDWPSGAEQDRIWDCEVRQCLRAPPNSVRRR